MIDNFAVLVTHALMLLACWMLLKRPELDREGAPEKRTIRPPRPDSRR